VNTAGFELPGFERLAPHIGVVLHNATEHSLRPAVSPHSAFIKDVLTASDALGQSAGEFDATAVSNDHAIIGDQALTLLVQRPGLATDYHPYRRFDRQTSGAHEEHDLIDRVLEPHVKEWSTPIQALNSIANRIEAHERPAFMYLSSHQVQTLEQTFNQIVGTEPGATAIGGSSGIFKYLNEKQIRALVNASRNLPTGLARGQSWMGIGQGAYHLTDLQRAEMKIDVFLLSEENARSFGLSGLNAALPSYAQNERPEILAQTLALTNARYKGRAIGALGPNFGAIPDQISTVIEHIEELPQGASKGVAIQGAIRGAKTLDLAKQERLYFAGTGMTQSAEGRGRVIGGFLAQHGDLHPEIAQQVVQDFMNEPRGEGLSFMLDAAGSGIGTLSRSDRDVVWDRVTASTARHRNCPVEAVATRMAQGRVQHPQALHQAQSDTRAKAIEAFAHAASALDHDEIERIFPRIDEFAHEDQQAAILGGLAANTGAWVHLPGRLTSLLHHTRYMNSERNQAKIYGRLARHAVYLNHNVNQEVVTAIAGFHDPIAAARALMWMNSCDRNESVSQRVAIRIQDSQRQLLAVRDLRLPAVRDRAIEHFYKNAEQQLAIKHLNDNKEMEQSLRESGFADEVIAQQIARRNELSMLQDRQLIEAPRRRKVEELSLSRHHDVTERVLGNHAETLAQGFEALALTQAHDTLGLQAAIQSARTSTQHCIISEIGQTSNAVVSAVTQSARQNIEAQASLANQLARHTDAAIQLTTAQQNERLNMVTTQTSHLRRDMYQVAGVLGSELISRDDTRRAIETLVASARLGAGSSGSGGHDPAATRLRMESDRWRIAQSRAAIASPFLTPAVDSFTVPISAAVGTASVVAAHGAVAVGTAIGGGLSAVATGAATGLAALCTIM